MSLESDAGSATEDEEDALDVVVGERVACR